jgi:hypothetical protein
MKTHTVLPWFSLDGWQGPQVASDFHLTFASHVFFPLSCLSVIIDTVVSFELKTVWEAPSSKLY